MTESGERSGAAVQQEHPDPGRLAAYIVGRLDEGTAAEVASHLAGCSPCRDRLASLPNDDPLANLLRSLPVEIRRQAGADAAVPPELVGHPRYEVLGEIGRGGMGVVYKARHKLMDRAVAIKVIRRRLITRAGAVERFRGEVQTAAKFDHPNVVRVFDADQAGGMHFLVMEHVEGIDLARLVQERGPLPAAERVRVCPAGRVGSPARPRAGPRPPRREALEPDADGRMARSRFSTSSWPPCSARTRPPHEDADEDADTPEASSLTVLGGHGMGTPDYVAPEQAVDVRLADVRSDIYSLGATLYFLLTGQPPFTEGSTSQRVLAHLVRTPKPLAEVRQDVPAGLAAVINRMMAKDASQRYQTPAEVAEALIPFASGIVGRGHHRRRFLVGAAVAGGLLAGGAAWLVFNRRSPSQAVEVRRFDGHQGPVQAVGFAPDGRQIVSGSDDRTVRLWSVETGEEVRRLSGHQDWVLCVAFLPDGRRVLSGSTDRTIRLWDWESKGEVGRLEGHEASVTCLSVSPDGTQVAVGVGRPDHPTLGLRVGRELRKLEGHRGPIQCVAFSADGRQGLSGGNDRTVRLWSLDDGRETRRLEGHTHVVRDAVFCREGRHALSGGQDRTTRLWNLEAGTEESGQRDYPERVFRVAAFGDRLWAVVVWEDGGCQLWDAGLGRESCRLVGHTATVWAAAFSGDGRRLLTGSVDRTIRLWQPPEAVT